LFPLKKNIFLTGFMGSGKTSLGKILAERLKVDFYDTDELVSSWQKLSVKEIFKRYGESFFREREREALKFLAEKEQGTCVISTGGGAVLREENRLLMKNSGLVVFLDVSPQEAYKRLKGTEDRPLLEVENPLEKIRALLEERKPFYDKADISVNTAGKTLPEVAAELLKKIKDYNS